MSTKCKKLKEIKLNKLMELENKKFNCVVNARVVFDDFDGFILNFQRVELVDNKLNTSFKKVVLSVEDELDDFDVESVNEIFEDEGLCFVKYKG